MGTEQQSHTLSIPNHPRTCGIRCISWSALILGAVIAIGFSFLLNLFSAAIGLSIYHANQNGSDTLAIGGIVGFAIGMIISMFFAGWITGYIGRAYCDKKYCGLLYGFGMWCLALVLMVLLALPFSHFVNNYSHYLTHTTTTLELPITQNQNIKMVDNADMQNIASDDLGKGAIILFALFFLGALSSAFGGYVGSISCRNNEYDHLCPGFFGS